jgi:hypothetical protein
MSSRGDHADVPEQEGLSTSADQPIAVSQSALYRLGVFVWFVGLSSSAGDRKTNNYHLQWPRVWWPCIGLDWPAAMLCGHTVLVPPGLGVIQTLPLGKLS